MADQMTEIAGYKLRNSLFTSTHTQVYEVIEKSSGRHLAMKILLPEHSDNSEARKTLFSEADIGIKMRHENVINILKVDKSMETPHFIMEFFPSGSLRSKLTSKDPKEKEFLKVNARKIFKGMATGLAYMNSSGYVHCDVKPDNVLVNASVQTKIIDFAISQKIKVGFLAKLLNRRRVPQGTRSYMSPEQIRGEMLDGRADIYCFGATWYELTTGRHPFRAATSSELLQKHLVEKPISPTSYNTDVTDEFGAFVLKMLAKKKEDRPESFHNILMELRKIRIFKSIADESDDEQNF